MCNYRDDKLSMNKVLNIIIPSSDYLKDIKLM